MDVKSGSKAIRSVSRTPATTKPAPARYTATHKASLQHSAASRLHTSAAPPASITNGAHASTTSQWRADMQKSRNRAVVALAADTSASSASSSDLSGSLSGTPSRVVNGGGCCFSMNMRIAGIERPSHAAGSDVSDVYDAGAGLDQRSQWFAKKLEALDEATQRYLVLSLEAPPKLCLTRHLSGAVWRAKWLICGVSSTHWLKTRYVTRLSWQSVWPLAVTNSKIWMCCVQLSCERRLLATLDEYIQRTDAQINAQLHTLLDAQQRMTGVSGFVKQTARHAQLSPMTQWPALGT
jgi:hypothetical protein